jgi:Glycosyl transferase family 2
MATMPARTAWGSRSQALATAMKSGSLLQVSVGKWWETSCSPLPKSLCSSSLGWAGIGLRSRSCFNSCQSASSLATDATPVVLCRLATTYPELRPIRLTVNVGQSAATAAGLLAAHGDWIATLDADTAHLTHSICPGHSAQIYSLELCWLVIDPIGAGHRPSGLGPWDGCIDVRDHEVGGEAVVQ